MVAARLCHGLFAARAGFPAILAIVALIVATGSGAAQSTSTVPLPRLSPGKPLTALPNEGGPGRADLPPGSSRAIAGDDTGPPGGVSPFGDGLTGDDFDTAAPYAGIDTTPDVGPPKDVRPGTFTLEARMTAEGPALGTGVRWRIFGSTPGPDGKLPLVSESSGGVVYLKLNPGSYLLHASYGLAGSLKRLNISGPTGGQVVVLNAGGLKLLAINGKDQPLSADVVFDVYVADESGASERAPLTSTPPGKVVGLTAGFYHIVSRYGSSNAQVRADIRVDAGKLTEATLYQKAARLTLKLVQSRGGEAVADTAWTVQAASGETVLASVVSAFPSVILAAGDYTATARHAGATYTLPFKVEAGVDRDVEVLVR
jgi:hypothetical protein